METSPSDDLSVMRGRKHALLVAIEKERSIKWQLRLWSRYIKTRDGFRCLCCESAERLQAHHIIRKIRFPHGALDLGNGITLCPDCHAKVHARFNRKPDSALPLGPAQGDDQDEWSYLFGLLADDAVARELPQDEFYAISNKLMIFSINYQDFEETDGSVALGGFSRVRAMHEIWRGAPQEFYVDLAEQIGVMLLSGQAR